MLALQVAFPQLCSEQNMKKLLSITAAMMIMGLVAACQEKLQVKTPSEQALARERLDQAIAEVRRGHLPKAEKLLNDALLADPDNADAHNNKGNVLMTRNKYKEAILSFARAIELSADRVPYLFNRGYAYLLLGARREALRDFNRVIELKPDHYQALSYRGQIRMQSADFEGAILDLSHVLTLRPEDGAAYASRGVSHASLDRKVSALDDFTKAEVIFRRSGDDDNLAKLLKAKSALKLTETK